ncbi:MAG: hypothetical protein SVU32_08425 [Candidatus Nanohaloarchaea archaeon]|nr:hypothetical protein [Candidatus Nanohaloarchaea archaeon]
MYEQHSWTDRDVELTIGKRNDQFSYHFLAIDSAQRYEVMLWKDGTRDADLTGSRFREVADPGYYMDITAGDDRSRVTLRSGRDDATSHYADLREMDDELLMEVERELTAYMRDLGDPGADVVERFFEELRYEGLDL